VDGLTHRISEADSWFVSPRPDLAESAVGGPTTSDATCNSPIDTEKLEVALAPDNLQIGAPNDVYPDSPVAPPFPIVLEQRDGKGIEKTRWEVDPVPEDIVSQASEPDERCSEEDVVLDFLGLKVRPVCHFWYSITGCRDLISCC
jgi:hypothetical protein